jgi:hypothetical protein
MLCILKFTNRSHKFDVFREDFQEWKYGVSNSIIEFVEAFFSFLLISLICAQCSKVSSRNTNCDCRNKIRECQIRTRIRNLIFVLEDAKMNLGNLSTHSTIVFLVLHWFDSFHYKSDKVDLKKGIQICWIHKRDFQTRTQYLTLLCVFGEPRYTFVVVVNAFSNAYSAMRYVFGIFYKLLFKHYQM